MTIFQLLDISSDDISIGDNKEDKEFVITLYGKTNIDNEGFNKQEPVSEPFDDTYNVTSIKTTTN